MKPALLILSTLVVLSFQSCMSDDDPSLLENSERMLAGEMGSSKSWKLVSGFAYDDQGTTVGEMAFDACFLDNIYTFNNTESQEYSTVEGTMKCDVNDSAEIERGYWAFVESREKLLISANDLIHLEQSLFGKFASPPATVLTLNESEMELEFDYTMSGVPSGTFRFTFAAMD